MLFITNWMRPDFSEGGFCGFYPGRGSGSRSTVEYDVWAKKYRRSDEDPAQSHFGHLFFTLVRYDGFCDYGLRHFVMPDAKKILRARLVIGTEAFAGSVKAKARPWLLCELGAPMDMTKAAYVHWAVEVEIKGRKTPFQLKRKTKKGKK